MRERLRGPSPAPRAPRLLRLCLAVALLVPLLAACGSGSGDSVSVSPGAGGNGAETPAPAPSATPPYCGLKPEAQAARTNGGMTFPATTDYLGKSVDDARELATTRKLELRVVGEDGACHAITDDLSTSRINVYVEQGMVTAAGAF
jgi:hypothetical protein